MRETPGTRSISPSPIYIDRIIDPKIDPTTVKWVAILKLGLPTVGERN